MTEQQLCKMFKNIRFKSCPLNNFFFNTQQKLKKYTVHNKYSFQYNHSVQFISLLYLVYWFSIPSPGHGESFAVRVFSWWLSGLAHPYAILWETYVRASLKNNFWSKLELSRGKIYVANFIPPCKWGKSGSLFPAKYVISAWNTKI